eukprot:251114-Alexandrium_andersonii.AAC.1
MAGRKRLVSCAANRGSYDLLKVTQKVLGTFLGGAAFPLWVCLAPTGLELLMLGTMVERVALLLVNAARRAFWL